MCRVYVMYVLCVWGVCDVCIMCRVYVMYVLCVWGVCDVCNMCRMYVTWTIIRRKSKVDTSITY